MKMNVASHAQSEHELALEEALKRVKFFIPEAETVVQ